jgi:vacuolar-type H+-ATPase subunit I/STV1
METYKKQDALYNLYLLFGIASSFFGIFFGIFNLVSADKPVLPVIIASVLYLPILFLTFFFAIKWNNVSNTKNDLHPKFVTAIKQSGITGIYQNENMNFKEIIRTLSGRLANKELKKIKIIAYHGCRLLDAIEKYLKKAIPNGVKVKIMIAETDSLLLKEVWELENKPDQALEEKKTPGYGDQEKALDVIKGLEKLAKATKEDNNNISFEYKLYKTQARYALILIDEDWAWWTPYQPGIKVQNTTSFKLENQGDGSVFKQCLNHFYTLWNKLP